MALYIHRHEQRPGPDADDGHAALGGQVSLVLHPGALREDQQVVPALDGLQGVFHRLDVPLPPVYGESAQLPQHPVKDLVAEQLLLGHDVEPVIHRHLQGHQHRVPVAVVVRAQQGAVFRQVLPPDNGDRVKDVRHKGHQVIDEYEESVQRLFRLTHRPTPFRMMSSSASSLWAKSRSVVSSTTASSARRRGAAARWVSFQSRSSMARRMSS